MKRIVNASLAPGDLPLIVGDALATISPVIRSAGINNPEAEARLLISVALEWSLEQVWLRAEAPICRNDQERIIKVLRRRLAHEPFAYISGKQEFWSLEYLVGKGCLIPRPDSECLIEAALEILPPCNVSTSVLDLGTGSGCLLLSLLSECPALWGVGVDISSKALEYAERNAAKFSLSDRALFIRSDWGSCLNFRFDLVLCNPPYVEAGEVSALMPEVAHYEPAVALSGGRDGLDCYRLLAHRLPDLLTTDGKVCLEIGLGQVSSVKHIFSESGLQQYSEKKDLSGVVRCLVFAL
ncbi:MAG: protein-(glutamine-N5) methyltransferase, release factor-specific [Rhodospirillaceae bacterium]|nr:protein-(glutamine-N5) methyltransferase, release factor-specific [Rhodospirillaceae bacterium]